jgi:O-antigen/teichoic acid export membrane protein
MSMPANAQGGQIILDEVGSVPPSDPASIGRRVAKGAAWMVGLRIAFRCISVVSQLILVRLLSPTDFGLVASASVIYGMLGMLSELSTSMALMQMPNPTRADYDTAWTLGVLRGLAISAMLWFAAPLMGDYMRDPRVTDIVHVLAIAPVVSSFGSVGMVTLQRRLEFRQLFMFQLVGKVVAFLIAVGIAIVYRNYWALVFGGFAAQFIMVPLSYMFAPYRPAFSLSSARALLNFSKWLFVNNFLTMLDVSLMTLTLGRLNGVRDLGLYQVSYDLAAVPASEVAAPIRGPMYAGYARVADNLPALRDQVLAGFALLVMVTLPMSIGIAVTSDYVVHVALGAQWADATPIVALCAFYTLFDAIGHFTGGIYIVRHAQRLYVTIMAVSLLLRLALVIPGAIFGGVLGAVTGVMLSALANAILWFAFLRPLVQIDWMDLARVTWRSAAAASVMAACVVGAQMLWPRSDAPTVMALQWALLCGFGAVVHIGCQLLLWREAGKPAGPERHALDMVPGLLARVGLKWRPVRV